MMAEDSASLYPLRFTVNRLRCYYFLVPISNLYVKLSIAQRKADRSMHAPETSHECLFSPSWSLSLAVWPKCFCLVEQIRQALFLFLSSVNNRQPQSLQISICAGGVAQCTLLLVPQMIRGVSPRLMRPNYGDPSEAKAKEIQLTSSQFPSLSSHTPNS